MLAFLFWETFWLRNNAKLALNSVVVFCCRRCCLLLSGVNLKKTKTSFLVVLVNYLLRDVTWSWIFKTAILLSQWVLYGEMVYVGRIQRKLQLARELLAKLAGKKRRQRWTNLRRERRHAAAASPSCPPTPTHHIVGKEPSKPREKAKIQKQFSQHIRRFPCPSPPLPFFLPSHTRTHIRQ